LCACAPADWTQWARIIRADPVNAPLRSYSAPTIGDTQSFADGYDDSLEIWQCLQRGEIARDLTRMGRGVIGQEQHVIAEFRQ